MMSHIIARTNHNSRSSLNTDHQERDQQQRLLATKQRMGKTFTGNQVLGRLQTIGCVAIEITQKCNLDCTLCYLSEHSQQVDDVPIEEVFRRLDDTLHHYGPGTHVQITGGDPTLRKHSELIEIVRYANSLGLYTALFTNGISATRKLLTQLANVGLRDVAFHVDSTQRRDGGDDELALNDLREEYLQRTKGLGLMVIFNTTVHKGNFHQLPELVKFFKQRANQVGLVSFQLQADTGRGEWRKRDLVIDRSTVQTQIESGVEKPLPWEALQVGHRECHSYLPTIVVNNNIYPLVPNERFFADFVSDFEHINWDRQKPLAHTIWSFTKALIRKPSWWWRATKHGLSIALAITPDLIIARGRIEKLTFFVQNFMDAKELQQERIDACSFMVMTAEGPVSMCEHNAQRDEYILRPLEITRADGSKLHYQPLANQSNTENASPSQKKLRSIAIETS